MEFTAQQLRAIGINVVRAKLATGQIKTYYYHRATGMRLAGLPGSPEFLASFAAAEQSQLQRNAGTLAGLGAATSVPFMALPSPLSCDVRGWSTSEKMRRVEYQSILLRKFLPLVPAAILENM